MKSSNTNSVYVPPPHPILDTLLTALHQCWSDGETSEEVLMTLQRMRYWNNERELALWHQALTTILNHPTPESITGGSAAIPLWQLVEIGTNFSMDSEDQARDFLADFVQLIEQVYPPPEL